jgi:hypothetical protein
VRDPGCLLRGKRAWDAGKAEPVALGACLGDSFEEWTKSAVPALTRNPWSCRAEIFLFDAAAEGWQVFAARIYLYAQEFCFVALRVEDATGIGDECPV